jgi:hypothetical protein
LEENYVIDCLGNSALEHIKIYWNDS